jgi:polyribonucleotide nucleotidyltransferase
VKVVDFGAFVNFFGAKDGLVHISQISQRTRRQAVGRAQGRPRSRSSSWASTIAARPLSMKVVDQETGEDLTKK